MTPEAAPPVPIPAPVSRATWKLRALSLAWAAGGSVLGILGAVTQEIRQASLLVPFVAAPMIEEVMKPAGVYVLLVKWPQALTSRLYTALLSALSGLCFGLVENVVYLQVYFPNHTPALTLFRYTACLALHTITSFIVGFGINPRLLASVRGEIPLLQGNWKFFVIPMVLHSAFNIAAIPLGRALGP